MRTWLIAGQSTQVEAAGKFGAKFLSFWITVVLVVVVLVSVRVVHRRRRRKGGERT
jgi:hypothetical protein